MPRKIGLNNGEHNVIRAVVGIIKQHDKVLVAERPEGKSYSGYWEFPGGKIERNETVLHALSRELYEELGIDVLAAECLFQHTHAYPDKTVLLEICLVTAFEGLPFGKENQTLRWVNFTELLTLRLLEGNWPIIDKMKEIID